MKKLFRNIIRQLNKKQIGGLSKCFIVSTGRTGTKFFEDFLNQINYDIQCYHEPPPDLYDLAIEKYRHHLEQKVLIDRIRKSRINYLMKLVRDKKSFYIESNNNVSFLTPEIKKAYTNAKFLIIVRDPRTYVVSALNKSPLNNGVYSFYEVNDHRNRLSPSDFKNDSLKNQWNEMQRFEKVAWYWNQCNSFLYDYHVTSDSSLLVKYEDLFNLDLEIRTHTFQSIFKFIGFELVDNDINKHLKNTFYKANKTENKHIPEFEKWLESDKKRLLEITYEMRTALKYEDQLK